VIYTIGPYLLPHLIPRVHAAAPSMPLLIQENYTARLAEALKRGDLDVIVVALPFEEPGIVTQAVYDEPFRVLLPAGHGWESEERIPASRLAEAPLLLLGAGNCFRDQVLGACPQVSSPETDVRLGHSIGTIRCMVASGLGVSVLPDSALQHPYSNDMISVIPFAQPAPPRRNCTTLHSRKSRALPAPAAANGTPRAPRVRSCHRRSRC
jgi:LysR family hydrogen peroxide-inducible transcriptional activator